MPPSIRKPVESQEDPNPSKSKDAKMVSDFRMPTLPAVRFPIRHIDGNSLMFAFRRASLLFTTTREFVRVIRVAVFALWMLVAGQPLFAQHGAQTTIAFGVNSPTGIAVDSSGNLYIANTPDFVEYLPSTGSGVGLLPLTVAKGTSSPGKIAIDSAGNIYATFSGSTQTYFLTNGASLAVPLTCGAGSQLATGVSNPGYVWISAGAEIDVCSQAGSKRLYTWTTTINAIAVDAQADIFFGDSLGRVYEVTPTTTNGPLASGFQTISGLAVDGLGNVFVSDSSANAVYELPGAVSQKIPIGSGFKNPQSLAIDLQGNLYISDFGNQRIVEIQIGPSLAFPVNPSCFQAAPPACTETLPFTVEVGEPTPLGAPKILTMGVPSQDFTLAPNGLTCVPLNPQTNSCTYSIQFTPKYAGVRRGALQIPDTSGSILAQFPLYGFGITGQPGFGPEAATVTLPASGLNEPIGVAADDAGNVFIADTYNNRIVELPAGGGAQKTVVSALSNPLAVALDGGGNLYIADWGNKRVLEVTPSTGASRTWGTGLAGPAGVAVDGAGNVFISDYTNNQIIKISAYNGAQTVLATGLAGPRGLAVDALGNVFVAASSGGEVMKVSPFGVQTLVYTGTPYAVAVDAAGDLYIADYSAIGLVEVTPTGTIISYTTGASHPGGVALDGAGNIYLPDSWNNRALKVTASQPKTVQFAATPVGQLSADSPKSVPVWNLGNASLSLTSVTMPPDFPAGSTSSNCTASSSGLIVPGSSCDVAIDFKPTVPGVLNESVVLARVSPVSSISIGVIGTGTQRASLTSPAANSILPGTTVTFAWSAGGGVTAYVLSLGTTGVGSTNIYNTSFSASTRSATVTGIPADGVTLYARLWSKINNAWQSTDYTFTEAGTPTPATLMAPSTSSPLPGSTVTFTWSSAGGITAYILSLGTTGVGSSNIYNTSFSASTKSVTVASIPTTGAKLYARLWSKINGTWQSRDYVFTEAP